MSEAATTASEQSRPAQKTSGKWRRRILRTLLIIVTLLVVVRVALFFVLGFVVRNVGHLYGVDISFSHQQLTLFAGDAGLWDVTVKAAGSNHELLTADYVRGKISPFALIKGRLHASRVEADGVSITVEREADGRIKAMDDVLAILAKAEGSPTNEPPKAPDFTAPLTIEAIRFQHVQIHVRDAMTSPEFQTVLNADLRVDGILKSLEKPAIIEADVWAENVLDIVRVRGTMNGLGRKLNTAFTIEGRGLNLASAGVYLTPLGLSPVEFDELRGLDFNAKLAFNTNAANTPTGLTAKLTIDNVSAADADGVAAALKKFELDIALIDIGKLHFDKLAIEGGRLNARRTEERRLRFAGLEFVEPVSSTTQPARTSTTRPPTTTPTTRRAYDLILPKVELRDLLARFEDDAISPKTSVELHLTQLDGAMRSIDNQRTTFDFTGNAESRGIARSLDISGAIHPSSSKCDASVNFEASGITLDGLRGYLNEWGIEPTFRDGNATGAAEVSLRLDHTGASFDMKLDKLLLQDGQQKLQLPQVTINRLAISPDASRIRVENVVLAGPELTIRHESDGAISLIGFRIDPEKLLTSSTTQPTTQPATQPSIRSNPLAGLPRLELGALTWNGVRVRIEDESTGKQRVFNLTEAGVELRDLVIDLNSSQATNAPGMVKAWLSVPDVAERIDVDGTVTSGANALDALFDVKGGGLNLVTLEPYLESTPVTPTLAKGSLGAKLKLHLASNEDALSADLELTDATIRDGKQELGGVNRLSIAGLRYDSVSLTGKSITIDKPRAIISRDENNVFAAMGIRVSMPEPRPGNAPGEIVPLPNIPVSISFDELAITNASLEVNDRFPETPVETTLTSSVKISPVSLGPDSSPMKIDITSAVKDAVGVAHVSGNAELSSSHMRASLAVDASDVTLKSITGYMPPGISPALQSGQFKIKIDALANANDAGGRSIKLDINNLSWRDGENILAQVDEFGLDAERVDIKNNVVTISSITSSGVESLATLNDDGSIDVFGFRIAPAPASTEPEPENAVVVTDEAGNVDVAAQLSQKRQTLPLVTIQKLDLGLKRFALGFASRPDSAPIEIVEASIRNNSPIQAGGADAESLPPIDLLINAAIKPLTGTNEIHLVATPFAQQPKLSIDLLVRGISSDGVTKLVPEISGIVDGSNLVNGQFKTKLEAELAIDRRNPTDFNLARGFGAQIKASEIEFRENPDAEISLGLESATIDGVKVKPNFAGVTVREINVQNPMVRAYRDADGIHALGLFMPLKLKDDSIESTDGTGETELVIEKSEPASPTTQPKPLPEVRIDRLVAQNIDLIIEDRSVTPQLVIPINQLDLEVKGLNTLALSESRAIRFNAMVGSGDVSLPKRDRSVPYADRPMEERPLLTRVAATGRLVLFPALDGYVKVNVSGAELAAFKGEAMDIANITLEDGIFDGRFDARFRDGGNLDLNARMVFTDLSLKEPSDGPIARALKLPAPIDVVIDAIEDPGGSITLPINVPVRAGEVNMGSVIGSGVGAVSQVVLTAFASAPIKMFGGGGDGPPAPDDVVLNFSAGDAFISADLQEQIESLILKMRRDKNLEVTIRHDMGSADLERAMIRSNPTREEALSLANALRAEKSALLAEREGLVVAAQAEVASRPVEQAESLGKLRLLDARIAEIDASMGELYDLLKRGAELQATARQRIAASILAQMRIESVKLLLIRKDVERSDVRVQTITPSLDATVDGAGRIVISATTKKRAK